MAAKYVTYRGRKYNLFGALTETFRHQIDLTNYGSPIDGEADWLPEARLEAAARRDAWLRAMPPRLRWWLIEACLDLAKEAAAVQESR